MGLVDVMLLITGLGLAAGLGALLMHTYAKHTIKAAQLADQAAHQATLSAQQISQQAALANALERAQTLSTALAERDAELGTLRSHALSAAAEVADLKARLEGVQAQHQARLAWIDEAKSQLTHQFQVLAQTILDEKTRHFSQHSESALGQLLTPLRERLQAFQVRVEETYDRESKERFSLQREIQRLAELNVKISDDAVNLTQALRGNNKLQGIWGERVLEQVLQSSGLRAGEEYLVQASLLTDEGARQQPDIVIRLPDGKQVVIDAKVSLLAFERCATAQDEALRQQALRQHVDSIQQHVRTLSAKNYQDLYGLKSLDFVLMFLPVESAFMLAASHDAGLFTRACERNVLLVSPSTLMVTLRTISNLWRQENQSRNALEIARHGAALYDKFVGFVESFEDIGRKLTASQQAYDQARIRLSNGRGNLIRQAERLRNLGVKPSKKLGADWLERGEALAGEDDGSDDSAHAEISAPVDCEAMGITDAKAEENIRAQTTLTSS